MNKQEAKAQFLQQIRNAKDFKITKKYDYGVAYKEYEQIKAEPLLFINKLKKLMKW
jgi:hypothetical protein